MQLRHLTLTHVRAFNHAEITFQPGMNLIVGINGVGKSTVLDTLRILLSQLLPKLTASKERQETFKSDDITFGHGALTAELQFAIHDQSFTYLAHQPHEKNPLAPPTADSTPALVKHYQLTPKATSVPRHWKTATEQPIAVYFPTRRSVPTMITLTKRKVSGQALAYVDALHSRSTFLQEFAQWWLVQHALAQDGSQIATTFLKVMDAAVLRFLDHYTQVRADRATEGSLPYLLLNKADLWLDARQLSDGERGLLAVVFDLAQRLAQANPTLSDPIRDGQAVVLIDELDLHLHPQWQRTIVTKLTTTFPNCQFIATTHSPLIIGEVQPSGLTLLSQDDRGTTVMQQGSQGFGLDSSWILQHLMGAESRNPKTQAQIDRVEAALEEGDLDLARQHLEQLKTMIHGNDDEVIRLEASINNLEALADAVDTEAE